MNSKISGVVVATDSAEQSAVPWCRHFGAQHRSETEEPALAALRTSYAVGDGTVDFLTPTGSGPVQTAVSARGRHLYAALLDVTDPSRLARGPYRESATVLTGSEQHFAWNSGALAGLRVIARPVEDRGQVGSLSQWYEVTWLVPEPAPAVEQLAAWLELDETHFVPNDDERWAYRGTLTLFAAGRLPRFEVATPFDEEMPMGRFFKRFGSSLYMAFAESSRMTDIVQTARNTGALSVEEDNQGPHTIFALPKALGGVLLGVSREGYAWNWSSGRVLS